MHELFWDGRNDGLFTTGSDAEALIARTKDLFDNASPSANSLAAVGLARLAELTGRADLGDRALAIVRLLAEIATQHPSGIRQPARCRRPARRRYDRDRHRR